MFDAFRCMLSNVKRYSIHVHVAVSLLLTGQFLQSIVSMNKAKKVLDLGMYTGYSALACAEALPDDGCVISCELEPYLENFARNLFAKSPHGKKIQIHMGKYRANIKM